MNLLNRIAIKSRLWGASALTLLLFLAFGLFSLYEMGDLGRPGHHHLDPCPKPDEPPGHLRDLVSRDAARNSQQDALAGKDHVSFPEKVSLVLCSVIYMIIILR